MPSKHHLRAGAAPEIAGSAGSGRPGRQHREPACRAAAAPAGILAERNTPFSSNKIKAIKKSH
jgi:hypothetical protein